MFLWNHWQWGQVSEKYSIRVTGALGSPIARSPGFSPMPAAAVGSGASAAAAGTAATAPMKKRREIIVVPSPVDIAPEVRCTPYSLHASMTANMGLMCDPSH